MLTDSKEFVSIKEKRRRCKHNQRKDRCGFCELKCRHKKRPARCEQCKLECPHGVLLTQIDKDTNKCAECVVANNLFSGDEEFAHLGFVKDRTNEQEALNGPQSLSPYLPPPHKHYWRRMCEICASVICKHGAIYAHCPKHERPVLKQRTATVTIWLKRKNTAHPVTK